MDSVLRIREITVKSCKTYFILVDLLRYEDFKNLSEDSLKRQLNAFDHVEDLKKDEKFYSSKAMLFFQLKNVSFIAAGNGKCLKIKPVSAKGLYLKAWINDIRVNYDEAIKLYDQIAELSHL